MFSLVLTLFISLLSVCPANNGLIEHQESNEIIDLCNSKPINCLFTENNYMYMSFSDFGSELFINNILGMAHGDYFPYTNTTWENFILGQSVSIPIVGHYDVSVGDFIDGAFVNYAVGTQSFEYISFFYDKTGETTQTFTTTLRYNGHNNVIKTTFCSSVEYPSFSGGISNIAMYRDGVLVYLDKSCVKININDLGDIFNPEMTNQSNYEMGYHTGYGAGYYTGYQEGSSTRQYSAVANTIFTGIFEIGLLPVNVFLTIFNFEVFGINISGVVGALLTISIVIIIFRFLLGGKKDD